MRDAYRKLCAEDNGFVAPAPERLLAQLAAQASGHLYEKLLQIMMVSVLRNTKSPVR